MNCLEFRRLVETDPDLKDEEFVRHKVECENCAAFAGRVARFSSTLNEAVHTDVPENLASRVLLRQSFLPSSLKFSRRRLFALAASMVAAVGLASSAGYLLYRQDPLATEVFTLIDYAEYAMQPKVPLGDQPVAKAISRAGLQLEGRLERVTFAGNCLLQQKIAGHLVIQGEKGPVTVFLISDLQIASRTKIHNDKLHGIVVPVGKGAFVVVGPPEESLSDLVDRITAAVRWHHA
ncbi:MAG: DUF3379 domain-containing protein [Gammaproteobacteria bacterium]|nr:DUF3379 domain-containing protein [Gammaproteobacteria bacterium]